MDQPTRPHRGRLLRAAATVTVLTAGLVPVLAAPAQAATVSEWREHTAWAGLDTQAEYVITFYGDPRSNTRKHLIIADKNGDETAEIRVWPRRNGSTDACDYIDYADDTGNSAAKHYDIYYPIGMAAYVYGDKVSAWQGRHDFSNGAYIWADC